MSHLPRVRWIVLGAIASGAILASLVGGSNASARAMSSSVHFTYTGSSSVRPDSPAFIDCNITVDNPHASTHVPETVNVVSHVSCSDIVSTITLDTKLYRGVTLVGTGHSQVNGWLLLNGNAASSSCINANYLGTASSTVTPPLGYTPSSASISNSNGPLAVTC